ncbi:hypothetical protein Cadr_000014061 [Camelus dromedarius]|uniref:Uncharacterized protein n=1 Tax=Camelus dromedarius TaxID=9838 RepID=A0A5N4DB50_CAMDR|nr:hypothetical protein Cadr_000014061 [Camelus dromedarius]
MVKCKCQKLEQVTYNRIQSNFFLLKCSQYIVKVIWQNQVSEEKLNIVNTKPSFGRTDKSNVVGEMVNGEDKQQVVKGYDSPQAAI